MTDFRLPWILSLVFSVSCNTEKESDKATTSATVGQSTKSWMFSVHAEQTTLSDGQLSFTGVSPSVIAFTDRPQRGFDPTTMEGLVNKWSENSDAFADDPPNAIFAGTYTHEDGTTSQCSIEVELMAAPKPGADEQWTWKTTELTRWEGCPDAKQTTVALSPSTLLAVGSSSDQSTCPDGFTEYVCDDGSQVCSDGLLLLGLVRPLGQALAYPRCRLAGD